MSLLQREMGRTEHVAAQQVLHILLVGRYKDEDLGLEVGIILNWIFTRTRCRNCIKVVKVKCSRYRPGVAQRVCRGIALLFHDRGTRRG